jgi:DNA-binding HxlR family transcriptional regulator
MASHLIGEDMCPRYQRAVEILGKRWTAMIIRTLLPHPRRFSDITSTIPGLSDRLLSERLKELEACAIVERRVFADTPVRIEYVLTSKGLELEQVVEAIQRWADRWDAPEEQATGDTEQGHASAAIGAT